MKSHLWFLAAILSLTSCTVSIDNDRSDENVVTKEQLAQILQTRDQQTGEVIQKVLTQMDQRLKQVEMKNAILPSKAAPENKTPQPPAKAK